jgi:malate dehydrogenase (oxaloacetate-decarboxylating)(NADP+)
MNQNSKRREALLYHAKPTPGKIQVVPQRNMHTKRFVFSLYTRCGRALFRNRKDVNNVYKYTAKGNLVAVITNGTAVLGFEILVLKLQSL